MYNISPSASADLMLIFILVITDSVVQETLRMCSGVFMVRYVTEDCDFKMDNGEVYQIRKGDRVAIYPPAIHKDPEIFEDPLVSFSLLTLIFFFFFFK